jgi:hypothetical protein
MTSSSEVDKTSVLLVMKATTRSFTRRSSPGTGWPLAFSVFQEGVVSTVSPSDSLGWAATGREVCTLAPPLESVLIAFSTRSHSMPKQHETTDKEVGHGKQNTTRFLAGFSQQHAFHPPWEPQFLVRPRPCLPFCIMAKFISHHQALLTSFLIHPLASPTNLS